MWRIGQIQVALPTLIRERFLQACDIAVLTCAPERFVSPLTAVVA